MDIKPLLPRLWANARPQTLRRAAWVVVPVAVATALIAVLVHPSSSARTGHSDARSTVSRPVRTQSVVPAVTVPLAVLARLPRATTGGTVIGAPLDRTPYATTSGTVAHPVRTVPVYARPGGRPIAALPPTQIGGSSTWLPVIATRPGWLHVLLPSRPNRATGWITTTSVEQAHSEYRITVALAAHRLTLYRGTRAVGAWVISAGRPATPTPTGRSFVLAEVSETVTHYSMVIWPLGTHSTSLDSFAGGPGTVAIHGWPDPSVFGHDLSSGCIRVPVAGLHALAAVPLGSLVTITP